MKRLALVLGVVVFILGIVALLHPNFEYHKQEQVAKIGPIEATVDEKKTAQIPVGVTVTLLVSGLVLVVIGSKAKG